MKKALLLTILASAVFNQAISAPWVEVDDMSLRVDIQLLADSGIINVPVTTYPLMWASIAPSIEQTNYSQLSEIQKMAFSHIKREMNKATLTGSKTKMGLYAASGTRQFSSFGNSDYEKIKIRASKEYINNNLAGKIQVNTRDGYDEFTGSNKTNFDGSFIAYKLGNWVVDAGAIEQWWGPGVDTSLIMSNNARPLPAIAVRRNDSAAFESPWLSWIGPWTLTAQMAQLESNRFVPDAKLWSSRATFRPFSQLEIGVAWSYQWGGKGQPNSIENFVRGLLGEVECVNGQATCDELFQTKLGNQLAGFDARWGDTIAGIPYAIYGQMIGEDSPKPGTIQITDKSFLWGIETQFSIGQQRIFTNLEYSDTQANCGPRGDTSQDCFYEHSIYKSGYRYYRRSIGSTYDNDAETLVLTLFGQQVNGNSWQVKFRNLDLNTNNRDLYPNDPALGNGVSKIAKQIDQLDLQYQFEVFEGRLTLGGLFSDVSFAQESETEFDFYLKYDILFGK